MEDLTIWAKALATGTLLSNSLHIEQMPIPNPPTNEIPFVTGYGMGVALQDVWLGHTGGVSGYVCFTFYYPEKDVTILTYFNKLSAFDLDANTADLKAYSENFIALSKIICPETFQGIK